MAWIELHQSVWTHRKTFTLAASLNVLDVTAVGHLARLWCWGLDNLGVEGELSNVTDSVIARAAGWTKKPETFVAALVEAEYIDVMNDERALHDWESYAGRLLRRRESNALRARTSRARNAHVMPTVRVSSADSTQPPYPTVPNPTVPPPNGGSAPKARAAKKERVPLSDEERAKLDHDFSSIGSISDRIEEALAHPAAKRCASEYLYCRAWLRRDLERMPTKLPGGTNGTRLRTRTGRGDDSGEYGPDAIAAFLAENNRQQEADIAAHPERYGIVPEVLSGA